MPPVLEHDTMLDNNLLWAPLCRHMSYTIFEKYANRNEEREALKGVEETYKTGLKAQIVHHQFLSDFARERVQ